MKASHLLITALLLIQQLFFTSTNLFAQTHNFDWAKQGGGSSESIAVDGAGNSYVTGYFYYGAVFGSTTLTGIGMRDMFITKYDAAGNVLWAKKGGGVDEDTGNGIAVDALGNSYITGYFTGSASFGNITLASNGDHDMFIVKYDAAGNVLWAKKGGGPYTDRGYGVAVDAHGNSYVTGIFRDSSSFDNVLLAGSGTICIIKYDPSGNVLWVKKSGTAWGYALGIVVDASSNIYLTGDFNGNGTFGNYTLTSIGTYDMFIAKYDSLGNVLWAKKAGASSIASGRGIALDIAGNSYVTGYFRGNATFDNNTIISSGSDDIFVVKYDRLGNVLWARNGGGANQDIGHAITVDLSGNTFVTGVFNGSTSPLSGSATFGNIMLFASGGRSMFIVQYDTSGNAIWATRAGGNDSNEGYGIAIDASGNKYVTGIFSVNIIFDNTTLSTFASYDYNMFITKLSSVVSGLDKETDKANIQVYPNPFITTFSLTLPAPTAEPLLIRMTDALGREVYKQTLATDAAGVVSVSPSKVLPAGLYQLQVQTAKASFTKKLVVE